MFESYEKMLETRFILCVSDFINFIKTPWFSRRREEKIQLQGSDELLNEFGRRIVNWKLVFVEKGSIWKYRGFVEQITRGHRQVVEIFVCARIANGETRRIYIYICIFFDRSNSD